MRKRSNPGFSLLELVLVVLILASLAAIVSVQMGAGIAADRLTVAARDLAATLRLAADRAALTGADQRVVLTFGASSGLRAEEQTDPLDKPGEWTNPGLSWSQTRAPHSSVRWAGVVLDPDQHKLREQLDELTAEGEGELVLRFSPDGQHQVHQLDDDNQAGGEPRTVEIKLVSTHEGEQPIYLRIESTGRIRTLTESQWTAENEEKGVSR